MADDDRRSQRSPAPDKVAAFERRAAALRANLKRRKAQLRGRAADQAPAEPDMTGDDPDDPIKSP